MDLFAGPLAFDLPTCLAVVAIVFAFTFLRYVVISGTWYLVTYRWFREAFRPHKLNPRYPDRKQLLEELSLGTQNLVCFCGFAVLILWLHVEGHTLLYSDVARHGWAWLVLSVPCVLVVQDAYFYWTHRLLHWKPLMKWAHAPHHRFRNPSPFAAFAVHPLEGALEVGFRPLIVCLLPLHPAAIAVLLVATFVINAVGHGGVELFRAGWSRHPVLGLLSSATHHYVHHKYVTANFGLYFAWWDKLMGTEHPKMHEEFEAAAVRPSAAPAPAPLALAVSGSGSGRFFRA